MVALFVLLSLVFIGSVGVSVDPQVEVVQGLVQRVLGDVLNYIHCYCQKYVDKFVFNIVPKVDPHRDFFILRKSEEVDRIHIEGTTGVAISHGLYMWERSLMSDYQVYEVLLQEFLELG